MSSYAVIVAVEHYSDKRISKVAYAENDGRAVDAALTALGFTTTLLLSAKATKATIESAVRRGAGALTADDTFFFFFAGHGFSKDDKNYLKCHDTVQGDQAKTSVELQAVFTAVRKSQAKRVALFLDACETGSEADLTVRGIFSVMNDRELEDFFKDTEFYVCFAACKADESSYSHGSVNHGIWTYHLVEALAGRAPLAMERGLVTSITLQNYLAKQVPLMVRSVRQKPDPQTPWACGAMSKEFVIADVRPILKAQQAQKLAAAKEITQAYLLGAKSQKVTRLSGFRKGHHVPDNVSSATKRFVATISEEDLKDHLDAIYRGLKDTLGYKKSEISIEPRGFTTADFQYSVSIDLDPDDTSSVVWHHRVEKMVDRDVIFSDEFAAVFKAFIDTAEYELATEFDVSAFIELIEDLDSDEITVHEERGAEECEVRVKGFDGVLVVGPYSVRVTGVRNATPRQLLEGMASAQKLLVAKSVPALPL